MNSTIPQQLLNFSKTYDEINARIKHAIENPDKGGLVIYYRNIDEKDFVGMMSKAPLSLRNRMKITTNDLHNIYLKQNHLRELCCKIRETNARIKKLEIDIQHLLNKEKEINKRMAIR